MLLDTLLLVFFLFAIAFFIGARVCHRGCKPWLAKDPKIAARRSLWCAVISLIVFITLLLIQLPKWG